MSLKTPVAFVATCLVLGVTGLFIGDFKATKSVQAQFVKCLPGQSAAECVDYGHGSGRAAGSGIGTGGPGAGTGGPGGGTAGGGTAGGGTAGGGTAGAGTTGGGTAAAGGIG